MWALSSQDGIFGHQSKQPELPTSPTTSSLPAMRVHPCKHGSQRQKGAWPPVPGCKCTCHSSRRQGRSREQQEGRGRLELRWEGGGGGARRATCLLGKSRPFVLFLLQSGDAGVPVRKLVSLCINITWISGQLTSGGRETSAAAVWENMEANCCHP